MAERPYLSAAFLCEKVLQEKDEVLTAVRIVDTFYVSIPKNVPADAAPAIQITALLAFKKATPGTGGEKHQALLRLRSPSGQVRELTTFDVIFKPEELSGWNAVINMGFGVKEFGQFFLDVLIDGEFTTCIRFRLLEKQEPTPTTIH